MCWDSPPPAQPFLCPLFTLRFPLEPLWRCGETRLGGQGRVGCSPSPSPSAGAMLVPTVITTVPMPDRRDGVDSPGGGFCCFSVLQLGAGAWMWAAKEGHPTALGWRAEVGNLTVLSVWMCTRGAWRAIYMGTPMCDPLQGCRWDGARPCGQGTRVRAGRQVHPLPHAPSRAVGGRRACREAVKAAGSGSKVPGELLPKHLCSSTAKTKPCKPWPCKPLSSLVLFCVKAAL